MFSKNFLAVLILSLPLACQRTAIAESAFSLCRGAAIKILNNPEICYGQTDSATNKKIANVSDFNDLRMLGDQLRRLGYLDLAQSLIERSLKISPTSQESYLSLAKINHAQYRHSFNLLDFKIESDSNLSNADSAFNFASKALFQYSDIINSLNNEITLISTSLNWLNLWTSLQGTTELIELRNKNEDFAKQLVKILKTHLMEKNDSSSIGSELKFSRFLIQASEFNKDYLADARAVTEDALTKALKLNDPRLLSDAEGFSGQLYRRSGQIEKAHSALLKAYSAAETIRANDLSWEWAWELAKISIREGDYQEGLNLYAIAVNRAEAVRSGMLSVKPDLQYSFRDEVEPLYQEYLAALFKNPNANVEKIIKTNENLQLSELENYLQCSRLNLENLLDLKSNNFNDSVLYFIRLPEQYAVIVRNQAGKLFYHFVDKKQLDALLIPVQRDIQGDNFLKNSKKDEFRSRFIQLNSLLIKPIEQYLPTQGEHLTLAIDSSFQKLPWGALYDGKQYLLEKYSLSLAIGSKIQTPRESNGHLSGLVAGVSQFPNNPEYRNLPFVEAEVNGVQSELKGKSLVNSQFTTEALLHDAKNARILHIATHGQFSSDPQNTFLVEWNGKFTLNQLDALLRNRQNSPLDLLVLSACDTAKGDRRALLGLAGTAIQSGAQSAVASLWLVNDKSQAILMHEFYNQLISNKKSKAEALRLAQIKLLKTEEYSSPYYWAGIVLLGSWL